MQDNDKILHHINTISQNVTIYDAKLLEEIKDHISSKYDTRINFIQEHVIDPIDRKITNTLKFYIHKQIDPQYLESLMYYIENILDDKSHYFNIPLQEAIKQNVIQSATGDYTDQIFIIVDILKATIRNIKIIQLFEADKKVLLTQKRDHLKIENAINILLDHTEDENLIYHLKQIKLNDSGISQSKLLSSFFYTYTKICTLGHLVNNTQAVQIAKDLMSQIFNSNKDYRIYNHTETFIYKDMHFTRYISKPIQS